MSAGRPNGKCPKFNHLQPVAATLRFCLVPEMVTVTGKSFLDVPEMHPRLVSIDSRLPGIAATCLPLLICVFGL